MLISVGHGRLERVGLTELLRSAQVEAVVDIRRFPGSRRNPDVGRDAMQQWLPDAGIEYRVDERLGGRRRLAPDAPREDPWWQVEQFAAYAAHTRTPEFAAGLDELLGQAAHTSTAMMCSESVWWRCHRRMIADFVVLVRGVDVRHLMPDGRLVAHRPTEGVRVREDRLLVYDGAGEAQSS